MSAASRHVWLGLTPEPERELPAAVAALRAHRSPEAGRPLDAWVAAENRRIEALIMNGTQRSWLRYLREVTDLVVAAASAGSAATPPTSAAATTPASSAVEASAGSVDDPSADLTAALALHTGETVLEHHRMLIGLPGSSYDTVAPQREALTRIVTDLQRRLAER